jgi:alpha-N-arabinofuranosidase
MLKHNEFAAAMRAVDPSMTIIGSGAMPDQMHARDAHENASLESILPRFGTEADWTGGLLAQAFGTFDGVSEHWYDRVEKRPDAPAADELIEFARSPSNQVRMKAEEWRIYEQRFPSIRDRHVFLSIDEYAYIGAPANLKMALAYSMVLQEMLRHTDSIKMAAFTMGVSTLDITPTAARLNTNGEVFKLYGEHFGEGTLPLAVDGDSPQPAPKYPVGFDHPQVRAGSPTYPLDVIAALSADRRTLKIAVVNATLLPQQLALRFDGGRVHGNGTVWVLTGPSPEAQNVVGKAAQVSVSKRALRAVPPILAVPPISTSIYEFPIALRR